MSYANQSNIMDEQYLDMIKKLSSEMARLRLSEEDLSTLKQIADKL
jgi:hypothetical protein